MAEPFDPYYQWLGIPPNEQPPNHYRLLGLNPLENNADVIDRKADALMAYLRTFQVSQHAEHSQELLNEVAAARICLLDPKTKAAYDTKLRRELERRLTPATRLKPPSVPPVANVRQPMGSRHLQDDSEEILDWLNEPPKATDEPSHVKDDSEEILGWLNEPTPKATHGGITAPAETRPCPFCAETIKFGAKKCRFCGEFLDDRLTTASTVGRTPAGQTRSLKDPVLAAILSFLIPGLGQVYTGRIVFGILLGVLCIFSYALVIPGIILHILLILEACGYAARLNQGTAKQGAGR